MALVHLLSSPDGSPEDLDTSAIIDNMLPDNSASNLLHKKD